MDIRTHSPIPTATLGSFPEQLLLDIIGETVAHLAWMPWWVNAGTLLGIVRAGELIAHDTDLDFALTDVDEIDLTHHGYELCRTVDYDGRRYQTAYVRHGVIVDFFHYYSTNDGPGHDGNLGCWTDSGLWAPPRALVEPYTIFPWNGMGLQAPHDPTGYLEWMYGPSWLTPHTSKQPWQNDAPNLIRR